MDTKPRIICLVRLLEKYTDDEHRLTTNEVISLMEKEYGLTVHRVTFKRDIEALKKIGYDIVETRETQNKYFLANRPFEVPELKLLIDAVESSKFITEGKSKVLIQKIHELASIHQSEKLKRDHYIVATVKSDNEQIYYIIDRISDAIDGNRQISFLYYDYDGEKNKVLKNDGEVYLLSPYYLLWESDNYYVLGYSEKREKMIVFRVDRIASTPHILDLERHPLPQDFDLNRFRKRSFKMYEGDIETVELQCDNSVMKIVIDKFGEDVPISPFDSDSFRMAVEVAVSPIFFSWIFSLSGKITIIGPQNVKNRYKQLIEETYNRLK